MEEIKNYKKDYHNSLGDLVEIRIKNNQIFDNEVYIKKLSQCFKENDIILNISIKSIADRLIWLFISYKRFKENNFNEYIKKNIENTGVFDLVKITGLQYYKFPEIELNDNILEIKEGDYLVLNIFGNINEDKFDSIFEFLKNDDDILPICLCKLDDTQNNCIICISVFDKKKFDFIVNRLVQKGFEKNYSVIAELIWYDLEPSLTSDSNRKKGFLSSRIAGFYTYSLSERQNYIIKNFNLNGKEKALLKRAGSLKFEIADKMIENVITTMPFPYSIATNFIINNKNYLIPMVIEEPSVVAGASRAAKIARESGGFHSKAANESLTKGQIQLVDIKNIEHIKEAIEKTKEEIIRISNKKFESLSKRGGGLKDISVNLFRTTKTTQMAIVDLIIDTKDAQGANIVTGIAEYLSPYIEDVCNAKANLRIISNFAPERIVEVNAIFKKEYIGGSKVVDNIIHAYAMADIDPYRAVTNNKGILNGVCAVVLATANDFRAVEAGAHLYAFKNGKYGSLTEWSKDELGNLCGNLKIPLQIGFIGGVTRVNPISAISFKILGVKNVRELSEVIGAVGLASNFAALSALVTKEGISKGHMKLHAKNIAISAGAKNGEIEEVAKMLIEKQDINMHRAKELVANIVNKAVNDC